ncbi:type IV secretory system conjugative DNA transfer family protein [Patescibacteria group bacterium]|nr:type IV secretory system conjugative DNA transfer family protein [Patescibacteria group bacterium]
MPIDYGHSHEQEITLFAETNFRNQKRRFGIKTDDRRRHVYVIGKTGMGKTTLLENFIVSDINQGHGCCYIDPHGDTAEKLVNFIPPNRINDVVYFNPADVDFPMGFNILETESEGQKPLVASGLMGVFKKIWPDVWSPRMEYILMNCVLALLDMPGATLLGINRILVDKEYRARVVAHLRDPIVKTFWVAEFTSWSEKYATEAIAPVQNKVGQFLSSSVIRNIVAQVKSTLNLRRIMDDGKILIVNLSKGRIGEDNMRLLGGMLITKIQLAAQERQNLAELERRDFYLYVDEFQNFGNESFASILSEARKYRLNLIVAHQYIEQLDEKVKAAIFGNVGTIIAMRVGGEDAASMETEFAPVFTPEDLTNLAKTQIYLKLMVDGVATKPFSANTLPPIAKKMDSEEKVIFVSRERYAEPRAVIEEKVLKWSGMELAASLAPAKAGAGAAPGLVDSVSNQDEEEEDIPMSALQYPKILTDEEREAQSQEKDSTELSLENDVAPPPQDYLIIRPERMAAITAAVAKSTGRQPKKDKPKFSHTCSRCSKKWDLPIQLDPSRPMYCPDCMPIVREERKQSSGEVRKVMRTAPTPEREEGSVAAPGRPRLSVAPSEERGTVKIVQQTEEGSASDDLSLAAMLRPARSAPAPSSTSGLVATRTPGSSEGDQDGEERKRRRRKRGGRKIREAEAARVQMANPASAPAAPRPQVPPPPVRPLHEPEIVALPDLSFDRPPSSLAANPSPPAQVVPPGQRVRFD